MAVWTEPGNNFDLWPSLSSAEQKRLTLSSSASVVRLISSTRRGWVIPLKWCPALCSYLADQSICRPLGLALLGILPTCPPRLFLSFDIVLLESKVGFQWVHCGAYNWPFTDITKAKADLNFQIWEWSRKACMGTVVVPQWGGKQKYVLCLDCGFNFIFTHCGLLVTFGSHESNYVYRIGIWKPSTCNPSSWASAHLNADVIDSQSGVVLVHSKSMTDGLKRFMYIMATVSL